MKRLEQLATLSRLFGRNKDFTIGGGGNTSFKTAERIWVKPSGVFLGQIKATEFAELDRARTRQIMFNSYSSIPAERESQVKNDLMACLANPASGLRPSVETSLHEAIEYDFVVHMHPYAVNALLCSRDAHKEALGLLGDDILYVEYVDPGYVLSKRVYDELQQFRAKTQHDPKVVLLENHGVFVGANSVDEISSIYRKLVDTISSRFRHEISTKEQPLPAGADTVIVALSKSRDGACVKGRFNPLIAHFLEPDNVNKVLTPLTPDQIVYCKANPLYIDGLEDRGQLHELLAAYESRHHYPCKVLLVRDIGLFAVDGSERSAELVAEVFEDWMKIGYYSENFGGPHFLTQQQIDFIDQWEVENYRRKMAAE